MFRARVLCALIPIPVNPCQAGVTLLVKNCQCPPEGVLAAAKCLVEVNAAIPKGVKGQCMQRSVRHRGIGSRFVILVSRDTPGTE